MCIRDSVWTYEVINTGNVALDSIELVDDVEGPIACPVATIAVGESIICTATGVAILGQYENNATVIGLPVDSSGTPIPGYRVDDPTGWPTAADPSHYVGMAETNERVETLAGASPQLEFPGPFTTAPSLLGPPNPQPAQTSETGTSGVDVLAFTGSEAGELASIASVFFITGGILLVGARRRKRQP